MSGRTALYFSFFSKTVPNVSAEEIDLGKSFLGVWSLPCRHDCFFAHHFRLSHPYIPASFYRAQLVWVNIGTATAHNDWLSSSTAIGTATCNQDMGFHSLMSGWIL
jgi:hypothetical protein